MSDDHTLEQLLEELRSDDWQTRYRAADQLKTYRDPRAVPDLINVLRDKNDTVRFVAAMTLGIIKDPRAVLPLVATLQATRDHDLQWATSWALLETGEGAAAPLTDALLKVDAMTRDIMCDVLGRLQDPIALPNLKTAFLEHGLADHATTGRFASADALERFEKHSLDAFLEGVRHDSPEVRARSADGLGNLGDGLGVALLIGLLQDTTIPFADGERTYRVCDAAADALGLIDTEEAREALAEWRGATSD